MKGFFRILQKDAVLFWSFWVSILTVIIAIGSIAASYTNLPPVLPLYNHMPWGYARLGRSYELFLLPIITVGIIFFNAFFGVRFITKTPLLVRFLFLTMVSLSLFMLIFIVRLILITL